MYFFADFAICVLKTDIPILRDSVCDGIRHCPDGEDETAAMGCNSK